MKKFLALALGSFLCLSANDQIQQECEPACSLCSCCCHPCLEYPVPLYEIYTNCGPGFGLRADVLYMNYTVPTLSYVAEVERVGFSEINHIRGPKAQSNVGFDVAVNYRMCSDPGYTFEAEWYHIVAEYEQNLSSGYLVPAHIVAIDAAQLGTAQNSARIAINFIDLVLRKDFRWGDYWTVSPAVGVVGGLMHTKDSAHYTNTGVPLWGTGVLARDIQFNQDLKYEGIGARLGSDFKARIWNGFQLMAGFYYNALYGFSKDTLQITADDTIFAALRGANAHYFAHHGRTFVDTLLGLSWEGDYCNHAMWWELHAGWKYQYFPAGWTQFEAEVNNAVRELPLHGQGLQAGFSLKF